MPYAAKVFNILIASPSDVQEEREIAVSAIQEWNELNSINQQIVLLPIRWETHTNPEYGARPQDIINRQIVDQCDILVGIFWTRLGSPTGISESGTLEEIERVSKSNKPVMLYFSKKSTDPDNIDTDQLEKLRDFKKITYKNSLVENFSNLVEFKEKFFKQIDRQILRIRNNQGELINGSINSTIILELHDYEEKGRLGDFQKIDSLYPNVTDYNEIPDYKSENTPRNPLAEVNKKYLKELVDYAIVNVNYSPIDFCIRNQGSLGARDLYVVLTFKSDNSEIDLMSLTEVVKKPKKNNRDKYLGIYEGSKRLDELEITKLDNNEWQVVFEIQALQPKREINVEDPIFIGSKKSCEISINAKIYADTIPDPIAFNFKIDLNVEEQDITYKELIEDELNGNS